MAGVALLPLSDIDAAIMEAERACMVLGMRGILLNSTINGEPLDLPKFRPLFAQMAKYDLPIWIHPSNIPIIQTPSALTQISIRGDLPKPSQGRLKTVVNKLIE